MACLKPMHAPTVLSCLLLVPLTAKQCANKGCGQASRFIFAQLYSPGHHPAALQKHPHPIHTPAMKPQA